ncbi:MAG: hypothetical protein ACLQVL_28750 [Terriglobia bacterium]
MYINNFQQQVLPYPGSILKAKSPGLRPDHLGIFAETLPNGTPMVLHSNGTCVVLTSWGQFALGRVVELVVEPSTLEQQRAILDRAYSQIGRRYDPLSASCEHFATWAFNRVPESPQLKKYAVGVGTLVVLGLFFGFGGETA